MLHSRASKLQQLIGATILLAIVGYNTGSPLTVLCISSEDSQAWTEFKSQFNKTYDKQDEEQRRLNIFLENKRYIDSQNTKSSQSNFEMGLNSLSDLTADEINASRNGFRPTSGTSLPDTTDPEGPAPAPQTGQSILEQLLAALNETGGSGGQSVVDEEEQQQRVGGGAGAGGERAWYDNLLGLTDLDYRAQGLVSRVKDQGSCGSCWAFATTGALESILAKRGRGVLLSEQQLVDCSGQYGNNGCDGGLMNAALRYVRDHGIMSSSDYPYAASQGSCKARPNLTAMTVRGSTTLPRGNEAYLRLALALTGPIPVAIDASLRSYHSYKSGVYDDRACRSSMRSLNHAVLLVGYGSDPKRGGDYWLLKNSWGSSWGDNGYIKIARNRGNLCGVATFAVLPRP